MGDFDPREVTDEMAGAVTAMGFDLTSAKKALIKCKGDIGLAIDALTSGQDLEVPTTSSKKDPDPDEQKRKDEAKERLRDDLDGAEGHLDLTLDDEKAFLDMYKKIM